MACAASLNPGCQRVSLDAPEALDESVLKMRLEAWASASFFERRCSGARLPMVNKYVSCAESHVFIVVTVSPKNTRYRPETT
jgi:hypothetical protein